MGVVYNTAPLRFPAKNGVILFLLLLQPIKCSAQKGSSLQMGTAQKTATTFRKSRFLQGKLWAPLMQRSHHGIGAFFRSI